MNCPVCKVPMNADEDEDALWWECPVCGMVIGEVKDE